MTLEKRVVALEGKTPAVSSTSHRIIIPKAGSLDDAIEAYGRDKIGSADQIIARRIVGPPRLEIVPAT